MDKELTLASLFDGSGGFPLGGMLAGIKPIWSSEIEPFAIRVTTKRLSKVKHYGDITKIKGNEVEPVDIITFGSPCQDMSIAGKRAGLDGSRSNLFYEAIRVVKEMRCATNGEKPRYIVWENVTGAFSSNKGDDFKSVLEEICKVKHQELSIPKPAKWHGEYLMLSFGEFPREEIVSTLSQILEETVPQKYYLSQRACQGILRRASSRGRTLPETLKIALENQAS